MSSLSVHLGWIYQNCKGSSLSENYKRKPAFIAAAEPSLRMCLQCTRWELCYWLTPWAASSRSKTWALTEREAHTSGTCVALKRLPSPALNAGSKKYFPSFFTINKRNSNTLFFLYAALTFLTGQNKNQFMKRIPLFYQIPKVVMTGIFCPQLRQWAFESKQRYAPHLLGTLFFDVFPRWKRQVLRLSFCKWRIFPPCL